MLRPSPRPPRTWRRIALVGSALAAMLLVTVDAASYAATGSSLVLGRLNTSGATTTVESSGGGAVLRLLTSSSSSAPFSTNATGKVANLNADRLDGLDSSTLISAARTGVDAARLQGRTAAEVAALAAVPRFTFARTSVVQQANPGASPGVLSAAGATPGTYDVAGTLTLPCSAISADGFVVDLVVVRSSTDVTPVVRDLEVPSASCGRPLPLRARAAMTATSRLLLTVLDVSAGDLSAGALTFALTAVPAPSAL